MDGFWNALTHPPRLLAYLGLCCITVGVLMLLIRVLPIRRLLIGSSDPLFPLLRPIGLGLLAFGGMLGIVAWLMIALNVGPRLTEQISLPRPTSLPQALVTPSVPTLNLSVPPAPLTLDQALTQLPTGYVGFNTPEKAHVGKQFIVEAKLSLRLPKEEIQVLIDEPGKREVESLKIAKRMVATLEGGLAFDISPSGPQQQWISERETSDWVWQVTPKTVGEQTLVLSFDAIISLDGKEDKRKFNTFKRRIDVDVGWPETWGEWLELTKKTGENISWIWVTLLIPVGGAIWAWIKRGERSKAGSAIDDT
jgi:hypothetical protein